MLWGQAIPKSQGLKTIKIYFPLRTHTQPRSSGGSAYHSDSGVWDDGGWKVFHWQWHSQAWHHKAHFHTQPMSTCGQLVTCLQGLKNHNPPICPGEENEIPSNDNNTSCDGIELANVHLTSLHPPKVYFLKLFFYILLLCIYLPN